MKSKFVKKDFVLVILSLLFSNTLMGCSIDAPTTDSYNKKDSSISQNEKKEVSKDSSFSQNIKNEIPKDSSKEVNPAEKLDKDDNNISLKTAKVNGKVKLYEGIYFDDKRFGENMLKTYCEVVISNITDTSFDFTVYQVVNAEKEEKKVIFLKNTAVFIGDGTKAAFYGKKYTLNFTFPNHHGAYPIATDMEISGFKPLEGNTYVNNGIPGHEFG